MITSADVRERVTQQPFFPFRIVTSSGQAYNVRHPEFVLIGKRTIVVGQPIHDDDAEWDLAQLVSVLHITALEPISVPSTEERR
jgi:hypothetical protein